MSLAVGIDLQPFIEVEYSLKAFGERYTRLLFTTAELSGKGSPPSVGSANDNGALSPAAFALGIGRPQWLAPLYVDL